MQRTLISGLLLWGVLLMQGPLIAQTGSETPSIGPSEEYLIGPKDIVTVSVYGEPTLSGDYEVSESGIIRFPLLKEVRIGGMGRQAAAEKIEKLLEKDYFVDVQLSLGIKEFRSYSVNVMGEIKSPGKKYLKSQMTLLDVLSDAGGLTAEAGEYITLQRMERDGPIEKTAVYQIKVDELATGSPYAQFRILPGDIVTINPKMYFYIQGEVAKPGKYEIGKDLTILKAIALAGGLAKFANEKDVELHRESSGDKQIIKLNIKDIRKQKAEDIFLLPSDTIIVNKRIF
jgi:polysaccharide export outer membrane protein